MLAVIPMWYLVDRASGEGWGAVIDEVWRRRTFDLVTRSVGLAVTVTVICVVVGVTAAWLVARTDLPGRRFIQVALALPLAIPSYLSAFAWVSWRPSLAGFGGAVLVLVATSYPYVYLPTLAALRRLDPAHEEVARSLGRRPMQVAVQLTLRQLRPAITAGALLVVLYVLSDFGAVATMRYEVFTWVIFGAYRAGFNPSRAAILSCVLIGVAMIVVAAESRARGRAEVARIGSGTPRTARPLPLGPGRIPALSFVSAILVPAVVFPVARILYWMQTSESELSPLGEVASALGSTLALSLLAAVAAILVALPVGILAARFRSMTVRTIERSTYVAHALPGIVIAISLVFIGARVVRPIYQRTPLLVIGYVVLFLPLAVGAVRTSVEQSPIRLEEVARSLGTTSSGVVRRVTAPLAMPGIAAGATMVFLATMKELPATLVLRPTGTETLALRLWNFTTVSDYSAAAPYALALMVFAAVPTALLGGALSWRRSS